MTPTELQGILGVAQDGAFGPVSQAALVAHFTNPQAPAVNNADMVALASRLGCTTQQLRAVSLVESGGGGFDKKGRPKILYERHLFHRLTDGKWSPAPFSQAAGGGYGEDSWVKLGQACARDPDAAFSACSWGKFQVLGMHWSKLGYPSPYALAWTTAQSEADHYELLTRYIEVFGLKAALHKLSTDPEDCRAFAAAYNGSGYRRFDYHTKLARAMK